MPFPFMSRYHIPVLGRKTPILTLLVPSQSPTIGRSPRLPNGPRIVSFGEPSHLPLPFRSKNHSPVLGRKTPILLSPPFQSPTTGRSPETPKSKQLSVLQLPSFASPSASNSQRMLVDRRLVLDPPPVLVELWGR